MTQTIIPDQLTYYIVVDGNDMLVTYGVIDRGMVFSTGQPKMTAYVDKDAFLNALRDHLDVTGEEFLKDLDEAVAAAESVAAQQPAP
jgi:hypothetical protein